MHPIRVNLLTDGTSSIALGFLPGDALYDEGIPTEVLKVTGIALSGTTATIAPRSLEDMQKYTAPIVHDTKELPYQQSFDNENEDYDGTSQLPTGWACTGTVPFVTANMDGAIGALHSSGTISLMDEAVGLNVLTGVSILVLSMLGVLLGKDVDNKKK